MHLWQFIPVLLLFGVGMGFGFGSLFAAVLNGVDASHAGSASGTLNAIQQVGSAIGIAVVGVVFFGQLGSAASQSFAQVEPQLRQQLTSAHVPATQQTQIVNGAQTCFVDRSKSKDPTQTPQSCKMIRAAVTQKLTSRYRRRYLRLMYKTSHTHSVRHVSTVLRYLRSYSV